MALWTVSSVLEEVFTIYLAVCGVLWNERKLRGNGSVIVICVGRVALAGPTQAPL